MDETLVPLGELVTTHGLDGWLKLNAFNPGTTALTPGREVYLVRQDAAPAAKPLEACRPHRTQWLVKLGGIDSIDAAKRWVGSRLCVQAAALEELRPGEYFHYQVIGFEVFSSAGERIGTITGTLATAAGEIYVVQGAEREHLVPAVKELIEKVDFTAGRVIIDPPDGLLDL